MDFFLSQDNALDSDTCDVFIQYYEKYKEEWVEPKIYGKNGALQVDKKHKDCCQISLDLDHMYSHWESPVNKLLSCMTKGMFSYIEKYPSIQYIKKIYFDKIFNIQKYLPGQGFKGWHTENTGEVYNKNRCLVWMIYLNSVDDGGTEFMNYPNQKAEKGKLLIWPAYFTHVHRGEVSYTKTKYILTGWYLHKDNE